ncbi:MAG: hypothetical protein LBE59_06135 [Nevskiaceae bacterium]|jgi:hypothetical protein|nr:hypothetical protein [Nevskiaceae bacterium]
MQSLRLCLAALLMLAATSASAAQSQPPANANCDRRCLFEFLTEYTEALTDNNLSRLKTAANLRVTANGVVTPLGGGEVWGKITRIPFRQAFVDPQTGSAIFYGTLTNNPTRNAERWWFYVVRLQIQNRQITEIEEIAFDGTLGGTPASSLRLADRIWDTVLPESERVDRKRLFELADMYFSAVSHEVDYHDVPWHPECQRIELAAFTVNSSNQPSSCGGEFQKPNVKWLVVNRRFYIADVERGVVVAIGNFTAPPDFPNNNPSVVMEVFKVQDGMLRHIEAFFRGNGQPRSGWGTGPGS